MRKALAFVLTLAMTASLLAACGKAPAQDGATDEQDAEPETPRQIEMLRLMFVPSHDPQGILAAAEPFERALTDALAEEGYEVGSVEIAVGGTYEAVGEALAAGEADVGIGMPGGTYVQYDDACEVILTATRDGLSKDSDNARDWNDEMPTVTVDRQTTFYRALILAGPSETGRALGAAVNAGGDLSWDELDAATWCVMGKTSSAGYIYPALWLKERFGKGVADLSHTVQAESYDDAFARLAAGEVDIVLTYADARRGFAEAWNAELGRSESIWGDTNVIGVTPGIYNDTITVSKASAVMDEGLSAALQEAFIRIAADTTAGQAVIAVYNHKGYQKAVPADYDNERAAQQLMQELG